ALVTVGNGYLEEYARRAGAKRIEVVPTVIDLDGYGPVSRGEKDYFSVGWIGTPMTEKYLKYVQPALAKMYSSGAQIKLVLVGARDIKPEGVPVQFRPWSEKTEVADIYSFDAGIMPLPDN